MKKKLYNDLTLNKTNITNCSTEFLDMEIAIIDNNLIITKLFDKRRTFPFKVIYFPFIDSSNIPTTPSYGIYLSQILRIVRICNQLEDFKVELYNLTLEFLNKGFDKRRLYNMFNKFVENYAKEWGKFGEVIELPDCLK